MVLGNKTIPNLKKYIMLLESVCTYLRELFTKESADTFNKYSSHTSTNRLPIAYYHTDSQNWLYNIELQTDLIREKGQIKFASSFTYVGSLRTNFVLCVLHCTFYCMT